MNREIHARRSPLSLPHLCGVIGGAGCIAFAPIFAVLSMTGPAGVGSWDAAFWRVFIGTIALGLLLLAQRKPLVPAPSDFRHGRGWIWLPGMAFGLDFWTWHWSFQHTSVANSTLLANTSILWVTLFAALVWKEQITGRFTLGAVCAFGGMVLLVLSSGNRIPPTAGNPVFGDFLALVTSIFYAIYQLSVKHYRRRHSAHILLFWASVVASLVLFPVALIHADPLVPGNAACWWALIGLGVLSHACGQGLIAWSLGGLPSSLAAVTLLVQPVLTALLGIFLLGQEMVALQTLGAIVVVVGLFLAIRGRGR